MTHTNQSFNSCQQLRRALVRYGTLNLATGHYEEGHTERVVRKCEAPLFSPEERQTGRCRSCAMGWTTPDNEPASPLDREGDLF